MGQYNYPSENSFVIPGKSPSGRIFTMREGDSGDPDVWKKVALVGLVILFFGSMGFIFWRGSKLEPVGDTRNFAASDDPTPWSFTGNPVAGPESFSNEQPIAVGTIEPAQQELSMVTETSAPARASPPVLPRQEPPGSYTIPTETPSQPVLSCNRVEWFKGALNITGVPNAIQRGDTVRFVGYASQTQTPIKSLTFRHSVGDQVIAEVERPASLVDGVWVADYSYVFEEYGQYRVTVIAVTPE